MNNELKGLIACYIYEFYYSDSAVPDVWFYGTDSCLDYHFLRDMIIEHAHHKGIILNPRRFLLTTVLDKLGVKHTLSDWWMMDNPSITMERIHWNE